MNHQIFSMLVIVRVTRVCNFSRRNKKRELIPWANLLQRSTIISPRAAMSPSSVYSRHMMESQRSSLARYSSRFLPLIPALSIHLYSLQHFVDEVQGSSVGDRNGVSSGFPSFGVGSASAALKWHPKGSASQQLGFLAFGDYMVGDRHKCFGV
jgi:hypothetical protein